MKEELQETLSSHFPTLRPEEHQAIAQAAAKTASEGLVAARRAHSDALALATSARTTDFDKALAYAMGRTLSQLDGSNNVTKPAIGSMSVVSAERYETPQEALARNETAWSEALRSGDQERIQATKLAVDGAKRAIAEAARAEAYEKVRAKALSQHIDRYQATVAEYNTEVDKHRQVLRKAHPASQEARDAQHELSLVERRGPPKPQAFEPPPQEGA